MNNEWKVYFLQSSLLNIQFIYSNEYSTGLRPFLKIFPPWWIYGLGKSHAAMSGDSMVCLTCTMLYFFQIRCSKTIDTSEIIGGARGVMVIVVGKGHDNTSSNPGRDWSHFA